MLKVELSHSDIAEIAHELNVNWYNQNDMPSQGYLEYEMCKVIHDKFGVNFFEEEKAQNQAKDDFIHTH